MIDDYLNADVVQACAHLVDRAGASEFVIGHVHEGVPVEEAGWYAYAQYQGTRITVEDHRSPSGAALALAERMLTAARCRCRQMVSLSDDRPGCRWRLVGNRWEPGCNAPPVPVDAKRGDLGALQAAIAEPANRAERRRRKRGKR